MTAIEPSESTWTLRLKHDKQIVFLHIDPLTPFDSIKKELIKALRERHPDGTIQPGLPIPSDPADIQLATPADPDDYAAGWVRLAPAAADDDDAKKGKKKKAVVSEFCPTTAGLADGAALAFRFAQEDAASSVVPIEGEAELWDVLQPSYDDVHVVPPGGEDDMAVE